MQKFQTEVNQLLHLIIHSLYSNKEIFLRELISNSSDALDKYKFLTLTDSKFKNSDFVPRIDISFVSDDKNSTITISDNGIGMDKKDLNQNLGTIARSGTKNFLSKMSGNSKKDSNLIGQFGVGFYSSFMAADKVDVLSRKAGNNKACLWSSDGKTGYTIEDSTRDSQGTTVTLHLNDEGKEFASKWQLDSIIKKYSDHISFPIFLEYNETVYGDKEKKEEDKIELKVDQINSASAFWKRPKSSIKKKEYNEFYKSISNDNQDSFMHIHTQAEGTLDYSTLFFIPKKAPFDMYNADYKSGIKLYIKRVFITDDDKELMPTYLRFVKGIIDSEDLPLNVSREILQQNKVLSKIKSNSVKKILDEFIKISKNEEQYSEFYNEFGKPIKEGLYQDFENRDILIDLVRFKTTKSEESLISFKNYVKNMNKDQDTIYYITGSDKKTIKYSPLLEVYNKKGIEVCLFEDEIDDIVFTGVREYKEYKLKSVNHSDSTDNLDGKDKKSDDVKVSEKMEIFIKNMKKILTNDVKDIKVSNRLTDSPCCLVADQNDPTSQMQQMMEAMGQASEDKIKPIMEINPNHKIIKKLVKIGKGKIFSDSIKLLYEQTLIIEGLKPDNPSEFVKRLNEVLNKSL
jgi:molecular chaperone HtpG